MTIKYLILLLTLTCHIGTGQVNNSALIATNEAKADIQFMINTIEDVHYDAYFKTSKSEFSKIKTAHFRTWSSDTISVREFIKTGMQLSALLSGGHTSLYWQNKQLTPALIQHEFFPCKVQLIENNQLKILSSKNNTLKEGQKIISINDQKANLLFEECASYIGGIEHFKNAYVEKIFPLYLFFNESIKAPYTIELDNHEKIVIHKGLSIQELEQFLGEDIAQENYSFEILYDSIAYIAYNECEDYEGFNQFLKTSFKEIERSKIKKLIIDIRHNSGGDSSLNDLLLAYLTDKKYRQFSGRFWKVSDQVKEKINLDSLWYNFLSPTFINQFLNAENQSHIEDFDDTFVSPEKPDNYYEGTSCFLIGANTFSSANFLADAIKTYQLSTLIGTPTGEYTNDFGEQINFQLPHSKCYLFVSSTYDIGANGNSEIMTTVQPDIKVENDQVEFAINWLKEQETKD